MFRYGQDCASILADAFIQGVKTWRTHGCPPFAFDSNRVMLYYGTRALGLHIEQGKVAMTEVMRHVQSNVNCLKAMQSITSMADPFVSVPFSNTMAPDACFDSVC